MRSLLHGMRRCGVVAWLLAGIAIVVANIGPAVAATLNLSYLEGKDPIAPDAITAYGTDLFGDKINLYNGSFEFQHTDLSLPGNSALPVALTRRLVPGQAEDVRGQFGDWDLEVPWIGGPFTIRDGWVTSSRGTNRCTAYSLPPNVTVAVGGCSDCLKKRGTIPATPTPTPTPTPTAGPVLNVGFIASEFLRRVSLNAPGSGSQEVLVRSAGTAAPSDGNAYPLVTSANWQIGCLPSLKNAAGEGFFAVAPDGTRYRFDWMATRGQSDIKKSGASLGRMDVFLMATRVEDRHGNWVTYTYDTGNALLLARIDSSDGRTITITNSGGVARSASDGTRTTNYSYDSAGHLTGVELPDHSRWAINLSPLSAPSSTLLGEGSTCDSPGSINTDTLIGTIQHPSGATATFTTRSIMFGRTFVDRYCKYVPNSNTKTYGAVYPKNVVNPTTLVQKDIGGPGMAALTWKYAYSAPSGWSNCTTGQCLSETRTTTVTEPTGWQTRHVFGNHWRLNEGKLLQLDEGWNGASALRTTTFRYRSATGQAYAAAYGYSLFPNADALAIANFPQDRKQVFQQGATFTWEADAQAAGFDAFARPKLVRRYSSLGFSRTEAMAYYDHMASWTLGQLASLREQTTGLEVERHEFDANRALVLRDYSFGRLVQSYTYNNDGTIATVSDAGGRATTLSQYRRGKPQLVQYVDGTSESQSINNLGRPDWRTNAAGTTTAYQYDAMGRVARIDYPAEAGGGYYPTTQVFEAVASSEYGLPAGHWRQTVSTGNARHVRYFDAMWRPRLDVQWDAANPNGTSAFVETRYDTGGRKSFTSYAERSFGSVDAARNGVALSYDPLGRVVTQLADSERGPLQTTTDYPANAYQRTVTNPRGYATTFQFQAFDTPGEDSIARIAAPENVLVTIPRDVFGKAISITRAGPSVSATRAYVYDAYQRLCKTVEPETGATIQDYDTAGNVAWRASGLSLTGLSGCDQASVPAARKVSFGYDSRDRLTSTTYGDGSPSVSRSYTADSLPHTINTSNFAWTLGYNNRRLMTSESLTTGWGTYTFAYGIDANGSVSSLAYPGGPTVSYAPDALGRPTQISNYLSGIAYHPNGAVAGYTAGNGIVYSTTQNARGLPSTWKHAGVVQDLYAYDADGNVQSITDQIDGSTSRTMGYDGLDRLTSANGIWGSGSFAYDALDNLTYSRVGARTLNHNIDAQTNRLASLTGSLNLSIGYDANGNITQRGSQGFQFDIGNRMSTATGVASYLYDGLGRRAWTQFASARTTFRIYGQSGRLLLTQDSAKGNTVHVHLGDKVVAETNSSTGTRWLHTDALGSPVVATGTGGALLERTRYEPYGATAAGTNPDGIGFTGHVNDPATGLVYMQQRYYDPLAGRFLSVDPQVANAMTGALFGRYSYANNNPLKYLDPDGELCTGSHIGSDDCARGGIASGRSGTVGGSFDSPSANASGHSATPTQSSHSANSGAAASAASSVTWGSMLPGTELGSAATLHWAEMEVKTGNWIFAVPGSLSALWTPDTAISTLTTLASSGPGILMARIPFWRYIGPTSRANSPWMTAGWRPPFGNDFAAAKSALQLPAIPNEVIRVNVPWWQPVIGPRIVSGNAQWGSGGGWEFAKGWWWP